MTEWINTITIYVFLGNSFYIFSDVEAMVEPIVGDIEGDAVGLNEVNDISDLR